MKIAVLGAGYAGLATAWHLLRSQKAQVTVFDPNGIGGKASGLAAGLLHPFAGMHAKLNHKGREAMEASEILLAAAEDALGEAVADHSGILRIALTEQQRIDFASCAELHSDVLWREDCSVEVEGAVAAPGIYLRSGIAVYSEKYLKGLWKACESLGGQFVNHALENETLYDAIVISMGIDSVAAGVSLRPVKGHLLEFAWPSGMPPLSCTLNSKAYLVMSADKKSVIAGATFERRFSSEMPDLEFAISEILPKAQAMFPAIADMKLLDCRAGIRASAPDHLPIAKQIDKKKWVFAGLGSKGLLYHSLYGKKIVDEILQ